MSIGDIINNQSKSRLEDLWELQSSLDSGEQIKKMRLRRREVWVVELPI